MKPIWILSLSLTLASLALFLVRSPREAGERISAGVGVETSAAEPVQTDEAMPIEAPEDPSEIALPDRNPRFDALLAIDDANARNYEIESYLRELARADPDKALALSLVAPDDSDDMRFLKAVFEIWAQEDPATAWLAAKRQAIEGRPFGIVATLDVVVEKDPEQAVSWLLEIEDKRSFDTENAFLMVTTTLSDKGEWELAGMLAQDIADIPTQTSAYSRLLMQWVESDPEAASLWLAELPEGESRALAAESAALKIASQDPGLAIDWASALPKGDSRAQAIAAAATQLAETDIERVSEWISLQAEDPDMDLALSDLSLMTPVLKEHLDTARIWAESVGDEKLRNTSLFVIAQEWAHRDPEAALAYVESSPLISERQRGKLLAILNGEALEDEPL